MKREKDTEMKEVNKLAEGLAESKHAVKEMSKEEIKDMVKEIGLKEERIEDEDREMEQEEEEERNDLLLQEYYILVYKLIVM